jgi:hypothetical protein
MPSSAREDLKTALTAGGVVGGFIGLIVYIWSAIKFITPAFQQQGLNTIQSSFITLGISLGIGIELSVLLGVLYGVIKALILFAIIYNAMKCFAGPDQATLTNASIEDGLSNISTNRALVELSSKKSDVIERQVEASPQKSQDLADEKKEKNPMPDGLFKPENGIELVVIEECAHQHQPGS